mmetsp:Transcript_31045/g.92367  ORF Transcript_31045/g.92367 Transcript_31045/m.92367 type:complete len:205 (+) Transcript_31045:842-1456(+)
MLCSTMRAACSATIAWSLLPAASAAPHHWLEELALAGRSAWRLSVRSPSAAGPPPTQPSETPCAWSARGGTVDGPVPSISAQTGAPPSAARPGARGCSAKASSMPCWWAASSSPQAAPLALGRLSSGSSAAGGMQPCCESPAKDSTARGSPASSPTTPRSGRAPSSVSRASRSPSQSPSAEGGPSRVWPSAGLPSAELPSANSS